MPVTKLPHRHRGIEYRARASTTSHSPLESAVCMFDVGRRYSYNHETYVELVNGYRATGNGHATPRCVRSGTRASQRNRSPLCHGTHRRTVYAFIRSIRTVFDVRLHIEQNISKCTSRMGMKISVHLMISVYFYVCDSFYGATLYSMP